METKQMFDKVKGEVSDVISKVAGKAEHIAKISKLKFEIVTRKSTIKSYYQQIGEYTYTKKKDFSKDTFIEDLFNKIDDLVKKNESTQNKIDKLKSVEKEEEDK